MYVCVCGGVPGGKGGHCACVCVCGGGGGAEGGGGEEVVVGVFWVYFVYIFVCVRACIQTVLCPPPAYSIFLF